jgi:outer membrane immunogenic protein
MFYFLDVAAELQPSAGCFGIQTVNADSRLGELMMKPIWAFATDTRVIGRTCGMKGIWGSSVAALLVAASSGAFAADLPVKAPYMAPIALYNWTGFYIGGNVGGAWETGTISDSFFGTSFSGSRSGFIGGGQIGYNWQFSPQFVLGVEWMFDGTDLRSDNTFFDAVAFSEKVDWITTVTARLGYAANNWLFYVKGGGGWVHDSGRVTDLANGFSVSLSDTKGGWVVGGGIEYGFTPNWTGKVEYQHLGLEDVTIAGPFVGETVTASRHFDMVTVGLNYKF